MKKILSNFFFFNKISIVTAIILSVGIAHLRFFPGRMLRDGYPSCFEIIVVRGGAYNEGAAYHPTDMITPGYGWFDATDQ